MNNLQAAYLAFVSGKQLKSRLETYTKSELETNPLDYLSWIDFFAELKIPENPDSGLITPPCLSSDKFKELSKKFGQERYKRIAVDCARFDLLRFGYL